METGVKAEIGIVGSAEGAQGPCGWWGAGTVSVETAAHSAALRRACSCHQEEGCVESS